MHTAHGFLASLTVVLAVAAVTTVLFQRLHQPVVLGYLIAGLIVGPHVPVPLVADPAVVQTLSELGVILLMFSLGLEFSIRKLVRLAPTAGVTAVLQSSLMAWLGFMIGRLLGWTTVESLFAGAIIAISSTTIVAKAFDEQRVAGRLRELVVGILIVQDLIAVVLMALLTGIASGTGLAPGQLVATLSRLAAFLVALVVLGLLIVPRTMRAIARLDRAETTLIASTGICFTIALLARAFGYSVALGAFIAGSLVAESGEERQVERLVEPVRDVFGAVFFVSVGMLIDPSLVARHWPAVAALAAAVVLGNLVGVSIGAFLTGSGMRTAIQAGLSLGQIGEFSFIIAALGLGLRATGAFLYPVAVTVSALTTLTTPWLIRVSGPVAAWLDRKLPKPLQTYAAFYASWVEDLRAAPHSDSAMVNVRRLLRLLVLDGAVLVGIVVVTANELPAILAAVRGSGLSDNVARIIVVTLAAAMAVPFCLGVLRVGRRLGVALARLALPAHTGARVDFALAPRRALVVTLQLASVMLVGGPLVALTQPFLPGIPAAAVLGAALVILGLAFWRSATNLQDHVLAGAQVILQALNVEGRGEGRRERGAVEQQSLERVHTMLPGLGALLAVRLDDTSGAIGKTLAQLNLRGVTGATVLAITRAGGGVIIPSGMELLSRGDVLALAGTHEAVEAGRRLLAEPFHGSAMPA